MDQKTDTLQMQLLDFATDKRTRWEKEHKLYAVHFEITSRCNLNCVHCYLQEHHAEKELPLAEILRILDLLYDQSVLFLTLTGGEIFARKDFADIYRYAKKRGFIIELFTNGVLLNDETLALIKQYPPLLVDVSLYGACEETYRKVTGAHGAFKKVVDNCRKMVAAGIRVALKSPILTLTLPEIEEMKQIAASLGVSFRPSFEIIPTIDKNTITKQLQITTEEMLRYEFEQAAERRPSQERRKAAAQGPTHNRSLFRCKVGRASCIIDYTGRLCPCMKLKHEGGALTEKSFQTVWSSFAKYESLSAHPDYPCLSCPVYDYCDLCPAEMGFLYTDLEHIDPVYCRVAWARKRFYEEGACVEDAILQGFPANLHN